MSTGVHAAGAAGFEQDGGIIVLQVRVTDRFGEEAGAAAKDEMRGVRNVCDGVALREVRQEGIPSYPSSMKSSSLRPRWRSPPWRGRANRGPRRPPPRLRAARPCPRRRRHSGGGRCCRRGSWCSVRRRPWGGCPPTVPDGSVRRRCRRSRTPVQRPSSRPAAQGKGSVISIFACRILFFCSAYPRTGVRSANAAVRAVIVRVAGCRSPR